MSILFVDGFDHYKIADIGKKWDNTVIDGFSTIDSVLARTGQSWRMTSLQDNNYFEKNVSNETTLIVGMAVNLSNFGTSGSKILQFFDGVSIQDTLRISNSGVVEFLRSNSVILASGISLNLNTWHYIEVKVTINNTTGSVVINVDGTETINETGLDTQISANSYVSTVRFGVVDTSDFQVAIDDIYILNTAGAAPHNDFLGPIKIETLYPSGNGNSSNFVGSDADSVDNYLLVDETDIDEDTTYVESSTISDLDLYAFDNMSLTPLTIFGIVENLCHKKDDAGTKTVRGKTRVNLTNYNGSTHTPAESYRIDQTIFEDNPDDSSPWEKADVDAAEFGIEIVS